MNLIKTSIKRPLTIIMVFLVVILFGGIGYTRMPADLMPKMDIPVLTIQTMWQGAGPEDVDEQISKKIDEKVSAVSKVKQTQTISQESVSFVVVQFDYGTDVDKVLNDVKSKVDDVQSQLPDGVEKSKVLKIDINAGAIASLVVTSDKSSDDIMKYAEDVIQNKIKAQDGVTSADIKGGENSEVNIIADPAVLSSYNVSLSTIKSTLANSNKTFPYGTITEGENKVTLRGMDQLRSLEDIKQIQIQTNKGQSVRLDQICDVQFGAKDKEDIYRYNGKESLVLDVNKQQDANTLAVMEDVKKAVAELNKSNSEYKITIVNDSSEYIKTSIENVLTEIFTAAIISFLVILVFLKNIRASLVVSLAIPTSIIGTIAVLYFTGETINIVTLSSLVISVGLVVDNSIVVIENIFKYKNNKKLTNEEATFHGTTTVSSAIIGSTLTIICVFLPILFTDGLTKIMFGALAKTIISALAISLIAAITIVPSVFNKLSGGKSSGKMKEKPSPIFDKISEGYKNLIDKSLKHKKIVVLLSTALFVLSIFGARFIGMDFMPASDKGKLSISITLPEGLDLKPSDYYVAMAEEKISDIPEIKTVITSLITSGTSVNSGNKASIHVELVPKEERKLSTAKVQEEIKARMATVPDCKVAVTMDSGFGGGGSSGGSDLALTLKGADLDTLDVLANQIKDKLGDINGLQNIETSIADTTQEAQFKIDKQKANKYGVNTGSIGSILNTAIGGKSVTTAKINDYDVDVNLKFKNDSINNIEDIKQIKIPNNKGQEIPLGNIVDIKMANGLKKISRNDGDYAISITASLKGIDTGTASKKAMEVVNQLNLPKDYEVSFGGNTQNMNESMSGLAYAILIAIVLVYMVMVAQFESFSKPLIIMSCIPYAFVGVVAALLITRISLSIVGMLGVVLLVGIVVNHGIVMIDYIEQLRRASENMPLDEIVAKGAAIRLRPVLMTVLTAALGMVPTALALHEGGEMMQPLAVVIIGGLIVSTLVTLILIPVIYMIFDNWEKKFGKKIHKFTEAISVKYENFKAEKVRPKFSKILNDDIEPKVIDSNENIDLKK